MRLNSMTYPLSLSPNATQLKLMYIKCKNNKLHTIDQRDLRRYLIDQGPNYEGYACFNPDGTFYAHGLGSLNVSKSEGYQGQFQNGCPHGYGEAIFSDGTVYLGDWHEGYQHGQGAVYYPSGYHYDGNWEFNQRHGFGFLYHPNGDAEMQYWVRGVKQDQLFEGGF